MNPLRLQQIDASLFPGVDVSGNRATWGAIAPRPAGDGWRDQDYANELRQLHERLGASAASLAHLDSLRVGEACCVVTGQQPGLLGGPLYTAYKVAGAVGLARSLSHSTGRQVVPVYWCGADDSDFDEVRGAWLWSPAGGAARAELPAQLLQTGVRVGSLRDARVGRMEREAVEHVFAGPGRAAALEELQALDDSLDFGERGCARLLRLFADAGLVVVDARSARLRWLGNPLFTRYAARHEELSAMLLERRGELQGAGHAVPISEEALQSGLFLLEGEHRRKLEAAKLGRAVAAEPDRVAPSVTLRPLWQDALLQPSAVLLGQAELAYHAQLDPLYSTLQVTPALRLPRPHVALLPQGLSNTLGLAQDGPALAQLLGSQESSRTLLGARALERGRRESWEELAAALRQPFEGHVESPDAFAAATAASRDRIESELLRLRDEWSSIALSERVSGGISWEEIPRLLFPRGRFQERVFAVAFGHALFARRWPAWLDALATASAEAYVDGRFPSLLGEFEWGDVR